MDYKDKRPIFMQIVDNCCERILSGEWQEGERIPSIRQYAADMEVNPNTMVRSYAYLQDVGVIENQRGIGFSVSSDARKQILAERRSRFKKEQVPTLFKEMHLLGITMSDLSAWWAEDENR
ncbi:MAG: GntR family transcriptional regulator [Marinifilaceae bacterium]